MAERTHNGIDAAPTYVNRIENLMDDLEKEKSEFMHRAKAIRTDIKLVLAEASDAGIPKKELRAVIKTRKLESRIEKLRDELEPDEIETYDQIRFVLGDLADTPLGEAALAKASDQPQQQ